MPPLTLVLLLALLAFGNGYTHPSEVMKLLVLKRELVSRGLGDMLSTWKCPFNDMDFMNCDPCGKYSGDDGSWGYLAGSSQYTDGWQHIACRTYDLSKDEFGPDRRDSVNLSNAGVVTTIHLTDLGIEGELATMHDALCPLTHLRELDVDGSHFTGPIPRWIGDCFPNLHELDLSFGRLSGNVPDWGEAWARGSKIDQFKFQHNRVTGTIPSNMFEKMPNLRIMWFHHNECDGLQHESAAHFDTLVCSLVGTIPPSLGESHSIISMDLRYNPRLCGPLPPTLHVDWDWQWDNSQNVDESWYGFCDKAASEASACGILVTKGTSVGRSCATSNSTRKCNPEFAQCGGSASPVIYKGNVIRYDAFPGPRCCESDLRCVFKDATFSQCIPKAAPTADHAFDGATDLAFLPKKGGSCSAPETQCGSSVVGMYSGPTTCCDSATRCVKLNSYYSRCLTEARAKQALAQFGADVNGAQSVVVSWGHGGGAATLNTSAPVGGGFRRR